MHSKLCFFSVIRGEHDIDLFNNNIQPTTTTTESVELDKSEECAACEAFITVFDDRLNNNSVKIDEIDIIELCDEVETTYKLQV